MPLWRRAVPATSAAPIWAVDGAWLVEWEAPRNWIRGESQYLNELIRLAGGGPRENGYLIAVDVELHREPRNKHDRNALRAHVHGQLIGYVAREVAVEIAPPLDKARVRSLRVPGVLRGGQLRSPALGVHIWISRGDVQGITIEGHHGEVSWPPWKGEGDA